MAGAVAATTIGFASGILSGAFGIGGGIVTTPAIRLLLGAPALVAVGTPLPVIVPTALTGALTYWRKGFVDMRSGIVIGLAGALTAAAGALGASRAGGTVVLIGTAALIIYAAADTALQIVRASSPRSPADKDRDGAESPALRVPVIIGLVAGLYSGFFGLGGGFVIVPLLTRWGRLPVKRAIGTSLMAVALLAVPGTAAHAYLGNVDWAMAGSLVIGVVPGALIGARITLGAVDRAVHIAFVVLLVAVGFWLGMSESLGWTP